MTTMKRTPSPAPPPQENHRNSLRDRAKSFVPRAALSAAIPLAVFSIFLLTQGKNPVQALSAMVTAITGSPYGFGEVIVQTCPLLLAGMAALLPGTVGVANAGGEGQVVCGAMGAALLGTTLLKNVPGFAGIPLLMAGGAVFGALWAMIAILCKMRLNMNETLTTLLMNFIMANFVGFLVFGPMKDTAGLNWPQSAEIGSQLRLATLPGTRINLGILIALLLTVAVWVLLNRTALGFRMRVVGGNTTAARFAGLDVARLQFWTFLAAGALAGLAGAIQIAGIEGRLRLATCANLGFMGFLAAGMAWNKPIPTIFSALLLAAISVSGNSMEISTGLPASTAQILMTLVLITILAVGRRRHHG